MVMDIPVAMDAEDGVRSCARWDRAGECSARLASDLSQYMTKSREEAAYGAPRCR